MALSYKAKRRWSLIILLIGLPAYIILCVVLTNLLPRPNIILEFIIYVALGIVWIFPFKKIFLGVGQVDQNESSKED